MVTSGDAHVVSDSAGDSGSSSSDATTTAGVIVMAVVVCVVMTSLVWFVVICRSRRRRRRHGPVTSSLRSGDAVTAVCDAACHRSSSLSDVDGSAQRLLTDASSLHADFLHTSTLLQ